MMRYLLTVLLLCSSFLSCASLFLDVSSDRTALHRCMTKREIQQTFGVESHEGVPEYDVTEPYQSTARGDFLSYNLHNKHKTKRSVGYQHDQHYTIRAFGRKLHLNLRENKDLIAPGLKLETYIDGKVVRSEIPRSVHYTGRVSDDPQSTVAITHHEGLSGIIQLNDDTLYIRPVPNRLVKGPNKKLEGTPHLVYRAVPRNVVTNYNDNEGHEIKRGDKHEVHFQSPKESDARSNNIHRYLELAFVADEQVQAVHGNNTSIFMQILVNMVAATFQDETFGKEKVTLVLTRLVILTNKQLTVKKTDGMSAKLDGVIRWAKHNNPADDTDPVHADLVALLAAGGGAGGRGDIACLCKSNRCANSASHMGLQSAATIEHEIGHNFGIPHDVDAGCPDGRYIMSSASVGGRTAMRWSNCSAQHIQRIIQSSRSSCLNDVPTTSSRPTLPPSMQGKRPGVLMDRVTQCKIQYGPDYTVCPTEHGNCGNLFCYARGTCRSALLPPADGTRCGPRNWCIKGDCVDDGSVMVDGGWSEWSDIRPCTKTCGGGVKYRHRTCTNPPLQNGGNYCEGFPSGHYEMCNTQECPVGLPSYRAVECKKKNPVYQPYYSGSDICKLICLDKKGFIYSYGYVEDGSRCSSYMGVLDVCVMGKCKTVGCDHVLESGSKRDRCGKCNGDGSTCEFVKGSYTKNYLKRGFRRADTILTLPVGASKIIFKERNATYNYIGVQNSKGQYVISLPNYSKRTFYAGSTIEYTREDYLGLDTLKIDGPLTEPLDIKFARTYSKNAGIDYEYYQPSSNTSSCKFEWQTGNWSVCSATCAGGIMTRQVSCIRTDDKTSVGVSACVDPKPAYKMDCNTRKCPAVWHLTNWKLCSKSCGKGNQSRTLLCRQKINSTYHVTVPQASCDAASKPNVKELFRYCNTIDCQPEWRGLDWTQCSTTCGPGVVTRKLQCYRVDESGVETVVADELCKHAVKPPTTEPCNEDKPCKAPPEIGIACFRTSKALLDQFEVLSNGKTVKECAQLAHDKGYTHFAMGYKGICYSGPNAVQLYYKGGAATKWNCVHGIGKNRFIYAYRLDGLPPVIAKGCFKDSYGNRVYPKLYANFRSQIDWRNMNKTISECAQVAHDMNHLYFAVHYYGECYTAPDDKAEQDYNRRGPSDQCWSGVGSGSSSYFYTFKQVT